MALPLRDPARAKLKKDVSCWAKEQSCQLKQRLHVGVEALGHVVRPLLTSELEGVLGWVGLCGRHAGDPEIPN